MISRCLYLVILFNFGGCYKILGVFPLPSHSHQIIFQSIWCELALRGHEVTVITPTVSNEPNLTNLRTIDTRFTLKLLQKSDFVRNVVDKSGLRLKLFLFKIAQEFLEVVFEDEEIQRLINSDTEYFDIILVQASHVHPLINAFGTKFAAPIVGISSMDVYLHTHDAVGNPTHPLVAPDIMLNFHGKLGFFDKVSSVFHNIMYRLVYHWYALPLADKVARKHFGNDIPYLGDVEKNISLILTTVNPIIHPVRPNVPNMIEINQIHIKEKKPLPKDLQEYLDSATEGVVYFSLGSNVRSANISLQTRNVIIQALSELPYKIIWKWETDNLPNKPNNVLTRKWIPQQDLLGHPNIKAFITQGGLQSIEEAITNEVPMVGLPYITDQPYNVRRLEDFGIAIGLNPRTMTKDQFKGAILEVAGNKKYKERMRVAKAILTDQPMKGVEKAVWWIEYVIRHKGAKHLRSPAADMTFFEYFLVDVAAFFLFCIFCVLYLLVKVIGWCRPKKRQLKEKVN